MTIKLYKTEPMKKLLWLLLLFAGMVNAQPTINNPSPYQVCDNNTNGFAAFDLNVITPVIITQAGTVVSYHLTLADSQAALDQIDLSTPYTNTGGIFVSYNWDGTNGVAPTTSSCQINTVLGTRNGVDGAYFNSAITSVAFFD